MFLNGKSEADLKRAAAAAPLQRIGTVDEIADVVAFLVSPKAGCVNGQMICVNGGIGKVILVTGAGSGIGRAVSQVLACAGHAVYASMRLNSEG